MERITARNPKGLAYLVKVKPDEQIVESAYPNTLRCITECFNHLAAYEDTGKTPEEIKDLLQKVEDGECVKLPCKIGTRVYIVGDQYSKLGCDGSCLNQYDMGSACAYWNEFTSTCENIIGQYGDKRIVSARMKYEYIPDFGKTTFLTRESAEQALKGIGGKE